MAFYKNYLLLSLLIITQLSYGKMWLPSIISDNMVLQQQSEATLWGWTTQGMETITVTSSWNNKPNTVKAFQGRWSVALPTPKAGGPHTITIKGHETIVLNNILIGEVWLCSGQSNMEWSASSGLLNGKEEIKNANHPNIRLFTVPRHQSETLQDNSLGKWEICTPETMKHFSAVGYFFGRNLKDSLNVPIGLINSSWGGSPIKIWIPKDDIFNDKDLVETIRNPENRWWPNSFGIAYNAMIHPLTSFDIAGAIWYQGESDRVHPETYYKTFPMMIDSWRKAWANEFPFYFVQIAPFNYQHSKNNSDAAIIRDAQLQTMKKAPHTGMVVTNDIGNVNNIHPKNKQEVGRRLALWALAKTYGVKNLVPSGPIFKKIEIKSKKAILYFDYLGSGLLKKGKKLEGFTIAGIDKKFYPATARIKGNTVEVYAKQVKVPKAVRFGFSDAGITNLYNKQGLPAAAFRTDDWSFD